MLPSWPVTPGPALGSPVTGGQYSVHDPVHLEVAWGSGANQYSVRPLALVTTATPPTAAVLKVAPPPATAGCAPALASATPSRARAATETAPIPAITIDRAMCTCPCTRAPRLTGSSA